MIRLETASEFLQAPTAPIGDLFEHKTQESNLSYARRLAQDPNYPDAAILDQVADRLANAICNIG